MKTLFMWVLGIVVAYILFILLGLIGCLYNGSLTWQDGWFRAVDANGQVIEPKPYVKPTEQEVKEIEAKYDEGKSNKASMFCFGALGAFILGWITGQSKFHTIGICLLVGALFWDYKVLATALFLWYFIVPALVIMGIVGLFKRS